MNAVSKNLMVIGFLVLAGIFVNAQETLNFAQVNEKTYSLYLGGDWKNLIKVGKKANKQGIDFYYLNIRMGIAFYNQKKYRQAIPYLEKALNNSPDDEFTLEYLYFAYLLSGKSNEADKLASKMTPELREQFKINIGHGFSVSIDSKFDKWQDYKITGQSTDTIQQSVQDKVNYIGLNAGFKLESGAKFFAGYSYVRLNENNIWLNSSDILTKIDRTLGQNQIYLGFSTRPAKGWDLIFSGNIIFYSLNDISSPVSSTSTLKMGYGPGGGSGPGSGGGSITGGYNTFSIYNSAVGNQFDYVFHAGLYKDFWLLKTGFTISFSGLNNNLQFQPGLNIIFFPLGNSHLFTTTTFNYMLQKYSDANINRFVFKQGIGIKLFGLYIEPSFALGEMDNFVESDGYVINNSNDLTKDKFEILAYTYLFKGKINPFFKYQNYKRINYYLINNVTQSIEYQYQSFIGGIIWNF